MYLTLGSATAILVIYEGLLDRDELLLLVIILLTRK